MIERVTYIESRDAILLEEDFPKRDEINGDFYYMKWKIPRQVGA